MSLAIILGVTAAAMLAIAAAGPVIERKAPLVADVLGLLGLILFAGLLFVFAPLIA